MNVISSLRSRGYDLQILKTSYLVSAFWTGFAGLRPRHGTNASADGQQQCRKKHDVHLWRKKTVKKKKKIFWKLAQLWIEKKKTASYCPNGTTATCCLKRGVGRVSGRQQFRPAHYYHRAILPVIFYLYFSLSLSLSHHSYFCYCCIIRVPVRIGTNRGILTTDEPSSRLDGQTGRVTTETVSLWGSLYDLDILGLWFGMYRCFFFPI